MLVKKRGPWLASGVVYAAVDGTTSFPVSVYEV